MTVPAVFQKIEQDNKRRVMADTWGHLFPTKTYQGYVIACKGEYRDYTVIKEKCEIDNSPWWYNALHDFVYKQLKKRPYGVIVRLDFIAKPVNARDEDGHKCERISIRLVKTKTFKLE